MTWLLTGSYLFIRSVQVGRHPGFSGQCSSIGKLSYAAPHTNNLLLRTAMQESQRKEAALNEPVKSAFGEPKLTYSSFSLESLSIVDNVRSNRAKGGQRCVRGTC